MPKNLTPWKTLSAEPILDTSYLNVEKERCELPSGTVISDFYTLWQPDWVLILASTAKGEWILESQYRHGVKKVSLEFPAGIIDAKESPIEAARRELQEECAYGGGTFECLAEMPVNPDRHRGRFFVVRAKGVSPQGSTRFDPGEDIETRLYSTASVLQKMRSGEMFHPHQIAAFFLYGEPFLEKFGLHEKNSI